MKLKYILSLFMVFCAFINVMAQNANRSGIFVEAGLGFGMGSLPTIIGAELKDSELKVKKATGFGFDIATGYRYAYNKSSALELKLKYETLVKSVPATSAIKIMPGYKQFVSKALGGSYFGINAGVIISSKGSTNRLGYVETAGFLNPMSVGFAYEVELGKCLTSNQYVGLFWDYQYLKGNSIKGYEKRDYGMLGLQYGYRF